MPERFVVLLRGVNVGRGNQVPMARFKALLEGLGHTGVSTVLNSGNAVFTSRKASPEPLARAIRSALKQDLDVDVPVIVLSAAALTAICDANPFQPVSEPSKFLVAFTDDPARLPALATLKDLLKPGERFHLGSAAAYLDCAHGILKCAAATALLGKQGVGLTTRNWNTVMKLVEKSAEGG